MFKFIINIRVYQSHFYDGLIDLLKAGPWRMYYMYNWNFLIFISVTNLLLFANVAAFLAVHLWFEEKHLKIILFLFLLQYMKLQIIMLCSVLSVSDFLKYCVKAGAFQLQSGAELFHRGQERPGCSFLFLNLSFHTKLLWPSIFLRFL